jgi:hypothetical protein
MKTTGLAMAPAIESYADHSKAKKDATGLAFAPGIDPYDDSKTKKKTTGFALAPGIDPRHDHSKAKKKIDEEKQSEIMDPDLVEEEIVPDNDEKITHAMSGERGRMLKERDDDVVIAIVIDHIIDVDDKEKPAGWLSRLWKLQIVGVAMVVIGTVVTVAFTTTNRKTKTPKDPPIMGPTDSPTISQFSTMHDV